VYRVFRRLENYEFVQVASREEFEQAIQLLDNLKSLWPGEYAVRDIEGNDPVRKEKRTRKSTIHGGSPIT
jgi:hypothetical protein